MSNDLPDDISAAPVFRGADSAPLSGWLTDVRYAPPTALPTQRAQRGGRPDRSGESSPSSPHLAAQPTPFRASTPTSTVLIADPLKASRAGLRAAMLECGIGRVIQADTVSGVEAILAEGLPGQLALVSLGFGDASYRLIHQLRRGAWQRVIALATNVDPDPLMAALEAGACGVLRGRPGTIDEVPGQVHQLTAREIEILAMVADGRSNKWIAGELALSALTVKSHLARMSRKLGTGDRSHLVAIAMRAGAIN